MLRRDHCRSTGCAGVTPAPAGLRQSAANARRRRGGDEHSLHRGQCLPWPRSRHGRHLRRDRQGGARIRRTRGETFVKVAIVGCGYVADFYVATRHAHPELEWTGAWDQNADRLDGCSKRWGLHAFRSLDELCADATISLVLNLTNPRSHLEITRRCLEAGKHVYSEKPLAMTTAEAVGLAELARARGRQLSSAPCSVLSPPAQTLWHAIRAGAIGTVRLVYGNFDDGM